MDHLSKNLELALNAIKKINGLLDLDLGPENDVAERQIEDEFALAFETLSGAFRKWRQKQNAKSRRI